MHSEARSAKLAPPRRKGVSAQTTSKCRERTSSDARSEGRSESEGRLVNRTEPNRTEPSARECAHRAHFKAVSVLERQPASVCVSVSVCDSGDGGAQPQTMRAMSFWRE